MALLWGKPAIRTNFNNKQWLEDTPNRSGTCMRVVARPSETNGEKAVLQLLMRPTAPKETPFHKHFGYREEIVVKRGRALFQMEGGELQMLKEGDKFVTPPGVCHRFWNAEDVGGEVTLLELTSFPGGLEGEGYLETVFGLAHDYGQLEKVPIPQVFMTLQALNGGFSGPKWLLSLLMFLFVPIAKLAGFKPMYPEYCLLSEAEARAKGIPIEPVPT